MTRESMVVYQSWLEAIHELPEAMQGELALAILEVGLEGQVTCKIGQTSKAMLALIRPMIDANNKKYENGKKGGRKPNENQTETKAEPKPNQNQTYNVLCNMLNDKCIMGEDNTPTPAREDLPSGTYISTSELYDRMANDTVWVMKVATNAQATAEAIRGELKEWCDGVMLTEDVKEITDARRHFIAWRRKRPKEQARPTDVGRPYRLRTYEQMLAECAKLGCSTEAYVAVKVRGKSKPSWVTKTEKDIYQIPDEL